MRNVAFFPYHPDLITLVEHREYLVDCRVTGFLSYVEDSRLVQSLNHACGIPDMTYKQIIEKCDTIVILDNYRKCKNDKYYDVLNSAIKNDKDVFITPLAQAQLNLEGYSNLYKSLESLPNGIMNVIEDDCKRKSKFGLRELYYVDIPVIGVVGVGKHCQKFDNQLFLREVFEEDKYNVVSICTNALGVLFGCYTMPTFLFEEISFHEKIVKFNAFIYFLLQHSVADVLILGIPEGIVPFVRDEFHHFAEYPLVLSTSVVIDSAILCTYFQKDMISASNIDNIVSFCQNKFNLPIGAIAISQTFAEMPADEHAEIIYEHQIDKSLLVNRQQSFTSDGITVYNLVDRKLITSSLKSIMQQFEVNVSTV